jgi:hypothetical protein
MDNLQSKEAFSDIPDRFYFNEMKREVTEASQLSREAELLVAANFIDLNNLGNIIERVTDSGTNAFARVLNSETQMVSELWGYTNHLFDETGERRGYEYNDFREISVGLCSAGVRLAGIIDLVKVQRIGIEAQTQFTNAVTSSIMMHAIMNIAANEQLSENEPQKALFARNLADEAYKKTGMEGGKKSWAWAKVHMVAESLQHTMTVREILAAFPEISTADTVMLRRQNDALADASQSLLTYTPKPAIGNLDGTDINTVIIDREVAGHNFSPAKSSAKFTHLRMFPHGSLTTSNAQMDYKRGHDGRGGIAKRIIIEGSGTSVAHCDLVIEENRSLLVMSRHLTEFAGAINASGQAEILRAMVLSQNFDLVVPSYIVDLSNEEATGIAVNHDSDPQADRLRRLVLARTRALNVLGTDIIQEIEDENQQDDVNHRNIIRHGVVGHIRRLPDGYSANQRARDLCKEQLGIEIPEGHTYVQIHQRGNVEASSRGHKMVKNHKAAGRLSIGIQ